LWFVETSANALGCVFADGRMVEHRVPIDNASLRGVTVGPDGLLWFTANFSNQIGAMTTQGETVAVRDLPTAKSGPRCIMTHSSGRMFYGAFDAGLLGEVRIS
jgi:virginiamycin B lyase